MDKIGILTRKIDINGGCENVSKQLYKTLKSKGKDVILLSMYESIDNEFVSIGVRDNYLHYVANAIVQKTKEIMVSLKITKLIVQVDSPLSIVFAPQLIRELSKICTIYCVLHNSPKSYVTFYGLNQNYSIKNVLKSIKILSFNIPLARYRFNKIKNIDGVKFVTISEGSKIELKDLFDIDSTVIYNPVTLPKIEKSRKSRLLKALYIGRMDNYQKNICGIIDAWSRIDRKNWELCLIGEGKDFKYVSKYISKRKIQQIELFYSFSHEQVIRVLQDCSAVLLFSNYEGFPTVITEAMANGAAIVTSRHDGFANEILKNEYNCLISNKTIDDFASKIQQLIDNPEMLEKLALGGIETLNKLAEEAERDRWEKMFSG